VLPGLSATDSELRWAFNDADKNGDGNITAEELAEVLKALGMSPNRAQIHEMVTSGDANGDGLIDYSEFRTAMLSSENPLWQSVNDGMQKVVALDAIRWHGRMCFQPVLMMLLCTMLACMSASSLLYHYSFTEGAVGHECATGLSAGMAQMDTKGKVVFMLTWATLPPIYFFLLCLSLVHLKLYQSLTDAHANVDSENETLTPRSGGRGALALAHESKTFTLGRMLWAYALSMALQVIIYFMLSRSTAHVETMTLAEVNGTDGSLNQTDGSSSWFQDFSLNELGGDKRSKSIARTLYVLVACGVFHLGQQSGAVIDYMKYSKECKFWDRFQVKRRITWHGRMMYSPCIVAVVQCLVFFYCAFTLVPYYRPEDAVCKADLVANFASFDKGAHCHCISTTVGVDLYDMRAGSESWQRILPNTSSCPPLLIEFVLCGSQNSATLQ